MTNARRILSSVLFLLGVVLVLLGFNSALGFTPSGLLATLAAVGALLYAGGVWFRGAAAPRPAAPEPHPGAPLVFDRNGRLLTSPSVGQPVAVAFPEALRAEITNRSAAALTGTSSRFTCLYNGQTLLMEALPVRDADGAIVCGILLPTYAQPAVATTA